MGIPTRNNKEIVQNFIQLAADGRLRNDVPQLGLVSNGPHWYSDTGQQYLHVNGMGEIISQVRLVGLLDAILCGYHVIIIDETKTFKRRNGKVVNYGFDWIWDDMHGCHGLCFPTERMRGGVRADRCIALFHVICGDRELNTYVSCLCCIVFIVD